MKLMRFRAWSIFTSLSLASQIHRRRMIRSAWLLCKTEAQFCPQTGSVHELIQISEILEDVSFLIIFPAEKK
jgi:hypothetical protein